MSVESKKEQEGIIEVLKQFPDEVRKLQAILKVNIAALAASSSGQNRGTVRITDSLRPISTRNVPMYGDVIISDDMEGGGTNFTGAGTGPGANNATLYSTVGKYVYEGVKSLLIETTATTPVASHTAVGVRYISTREHKLIKVEQMFNLGGNGNISYADFEYLFQDVDTSHDPIIRYDLANTRVQYANAAGSYVTLAAPLALVNLNNEQWHYLAFSFDMNTKQYIEVQLDENIVDLRGTAYYNAANVAATGGQYKATIKNVGANQSKLYIDNFLISAIKESI